MDKNIITTEYKEFLEQLKARVATSRYQAAQSVNKELIILYHHIGSEILTRQEQHAWGAKIIDKLSRDLISAFPEMKGFSTRNLKYMRQFAKEYPDSTFVQEVLAQLTWYHNVTLLGSYIRASTDKQDLTNQRHEILTYTNNNNLKVDEFIEIHMSSHKTAKQRRISELLEKLNSADILIVTEISRLGRSTSEIIGLTASLLKAKIKLIAIKQNLVIIHDRYDMNSKVMVTFFSLFAELEGDLVSLRTKEALKAKKANGIKLGKPVGTIQKSKFDKDIDKVKELLHMGLSVRKIAKYLGYPNYLSLNKYLNKRKIKEMAS
ncbi:recombinase family protein [Candidatus Tisiphia endosymbiont of Hybos culiciformis]|uniref:recombinase family protein n=1 Tax=Candidatus Tisiphia endosymbiont of Hybos culiciformis TaxID=3139331 RepID=UPI003CCA82AC